MRTHTGNTQSITNLKTTKLKNWQIDIFNNTKHNNTNSYDQRQHMYRVKFKNITQPKRKSLQGWPVERGGPEVRYPLEAGRLGRGTRGPLLYQSLRGGSQRLTTRSENILSEQPNSYETGTTTDANTATRNQPNASTSTQSTARTQSTSQTTTNASNTPNTCTPENALTTFCGTAGPPRGLALSGDQTYNPTTLPQTRNHKRGLRSALAREVRRGKRTAKRRKARQDQRERKRGKVKPTQETTTTETQATAQEPKTRGKIRLRLGTKLGIGSLNIRGVKKTGVREEVEQWMKSKNLAITGMQETRNKQNSRETRKQYTWFFSGEGGREEYTAGVGAVISNKYLKYIEDIEPITDRLMYIILKGTIEITIIIAYMPPADRPQEEKQKAYADLQKCIQKRTNKGPMYILGDWNARLIYPNTDEEEQIMGKQTAPKRRQNIRPKRAHKRKQRPTNRTMPNQRPSSHQHTIQKNIR